MTHDNVTDIVERLRAWEPFVSDGYQVPAAGQVMHEAAALIEAQQADLATLRKQLENAREVIIEANNSLYGSQGYFLSLNGGPPNKYHLAEGIEELKSNVRRLGISGWHFAKGMVCHDPQ